LWRANGGDRELHDLEARFRAMDRSAITGNFFDTQSSAWTVHGSSPGRDLARIAMTRWLLVRRHPSPIPCVSRRTSPHDWIRAWKNDRAIQTLGARGIQSSLM